MVATRAGQRADLTAVGRAAQTVERLVVTMAVQRAVKSVVSSAGLWVAQKVAK